MVANKKPTGWYFTMCEVFMQIEYNRIVRILLLLAFVILAPLGLLSQNKEDKPLKVPNPPTQKNSFETKNGMLTWLYHVQNRSPKELEPFLKEYITIRNKPSKYVVYTEQNAILFTIKKEHLELLQKLLAKIDAPRSQVLIEVKVISLAYEGEKQTGIEASQDMASKASHQNVFYRGFELSYHPQDYIKALTANPKNAAAAQDDFLGATMFFHSKGDSLDRLGGIGVAIRLLSHTKKVHLVARPVVIVEAGYTAKIETGEEVPISYVRYWGNTTIIDTTFKSVGINLIMKPLNIGTEYVQLYVQPEVSAVSSYFDPAGVGVSNPKIIRRNTQTTVTLKSGETLEIGGLRSDKTIVSSTGIPILSDIPLLGYLFRSNRKEVKRQDIIFFITPTIVKPGEIVRPEQFTHSNEDFENK